MADAPGVLVVVGRDRAELYEYFRWGFARTPGVEVILDRRLGERRGPRDASAPAEERRKRDRRRAAASRAELRARGFLIARRAPGGEREGALR